MRCPKCGSKNSDANRFCRSCGCRLETSAEQEQRVMTDAAAVDEVALGEQLFDVWQLFSSGDTQGARAMIEGMADDLPDRSSVHSLFALIYERQAEIELASGNIQTAQSLLHQALDRYERVVELNPRSVADREKLASLRKKLGAGKSDATADLGAQITAFFRKLPPPVIAAGAVFLLALAVGAFMLAPGPRKESRRTVVVRPAPRTQRTAPQAQTSEPANIPPSQGLQAYTFPMQPGPTVTIQRPKPTPPAPNPELKPGQRPPSIVVPFVPDMKVVPAKVSTTGKATNGSTRTPDRRTDNNQAARTNGEDDASEEKPKADGATMLARAIKLQDQGLTQQALTAAQQAVVLYDAEAAAGKNVDAAKRGAKTAKTMISLWQSSQNETEE